VSGVSVARAYDPAPERLAARILVDRLWPRGLARKDAPFESWTRDVAPSTALRQWYGHVPERFPEFADRYRDELASGVGHDALGRLARRAESEPLVLVTATRDVDHSGAAVLRDLLNGR